MALQPILHGTTADAISHDLLDVDEAAAYLRGTRRFMYELVQTGRVEHTRAGKRLIFRRQWLDDYLEVAHRPAVTRTSSGAV